MMRLFLAHVLIVGSLGDGRPSSLMPSINSAQCAGQTDMHACSSMLQLAAKDETVVTAFPHKERTKQTLEAALDHVGKTRLKCEEDSRDAIEFQTCNKTLDKREENLRKELDNLRKKQTVEAALGYVGKLRLKCEEDSHDAIEFQTCIEPLDKQERNLRKELDKIASVTPKP